MANKFEKPRFGKNRDISRREERRQSSSSGQGLGGANRIEDKTAPQSFTTDKKNTLEQPRAYAIDKEAAANFALADNIESQKERLDEIVDRIENARKKNPVIQKNLEQQAERLKELSTKRQEFEKAGKQKREEYNPKRQAELENQ